MVKAEPVTRFLACAMPKGNPTDHGWIDGPTKVNGGTVPAMEGEPLILEPRAYARQHRIRIEVLIRKLALASDISASALRSPQDAHAEQERPLSRVLPQEGVSDWSGGRP